MLTRFGLSQIVRLGVLAALLLSGGTSADAAQPNRRAAPVPSIVGFWMGESVVSPNGEKPANHDATYYDAADRSALTPEVWRVLQQYRIPLYLHVRYGRDFGPIKPGAQSDAISLVRKANSLGIPVIAWIVLPYEQGYWAYEGNAQENFQAVKAWVSWKRANRLQFVSVALDQEFSWQNLKTYIAARTSRDDGQKLSSWMRSNIDPSKQCDALRVYGELISWAHREGVRVDAAEAPMVADDLADGNLALQNGLQISGTTPGYDRMYVMAYRSAVAEMGLDPGPAYAATYFAAMQKYFGGVGQVSLGIPGQGPYATLTALVDEVRMLVGLGAKEIPIFSLEAMVEKFGAEGLKAVAQAERRPMADTELARFARPTPEFETLIAISKSQNALASELTVAATKERGRPQSPNAWPSGCDIPAVHPLKKTR